MHLTARYILGSDSWDMVAGCGVTFLQPAKHDSNADAVFFRKGLS